ncbi:unnamed protein product, partial [Ectocarpus fasciculatus]
TSGEHCYVRPGTTEFSWRLILGPLFFIVLPSWKCTEIHGINSYRLATRCCSCSMLSLLPLPMAVDFSHRNILGKCSIGCHEAGYPRSRAAWRRVLELDIDT